jgi:protein subunit release factor B
MKTNTNSGCTNKRSSAFTMHQAAALYARSLLELAIEKDQKSVQQRNLSQVQVSSKQGRYMLLPLS